ncbi:unnamed protein product [Adineta steineri]|uniref:G-protein coupled receptors family 1 profile domain-containing protein n=3 Tax=Adineta steineri TaxID=433720 RepID=A0A818NN91_9BILA|nr:unnamed protein product [Adineta steineri]CAF3607958.1 unnamed protein product [Adineta steineri]
MINDQTKTNGFILSSVSLGFNTFAGYLAAVLLGMLYFNFLNQAFYRLIRIVYSQNRWFQSLKLYIILPVIEIIVVTSILLCVLIPLNGVTYLPNDYFCCPTFTNIPTILSTAFVAYVCPFCCLIFIYMRITRFIHQQGNIQILIIKQRQSRDLLIIRRILIIVNLLLILGIPGMTLILMFVITGEENPLLVRITYFPISVSQAGLSIALLFCIPQLKNIVLNLRKTTTVTPANQVVQGTIQMNTIAGTQ